MPQPPHEPVPEARIEVLRVRPQGALSKLGKGVPQNYSEAVQWYRWAAEQGHAKAQFLLAIMYANGEGVPQNGPEAFKWLSLAAEQGEATAQWMLGVKYEIGRGVPQNYVEAAKWYRRAAEQGQRQAQEFLGHMYEEGTGVPQDYVQAYIWYSLASARASGSNREESTRNRDRVAQKMISVQLARAQELASAWQPHPERSKVPIEPSSRTAAPLQMA
jgi:hypothetical protein